MRVKRKSNNRNNNCNFNSYYRMNTRMQKFVYLIIMNYRNNIVSYRIDTIAHELLFMIVLSLDAMHSCMSTFNYRSYS